jgi:THO complex subunit 4
VTPHTAPASSSRLNAPLARLGNAAAAPSQTPATCRIAVSNLNETVSQEDIKELFGDVGPLVNAKLHKDSSGRSLGRAEVVFVRMADALEAIKRYNGIPLDEMPLRITLATDRSTSAVESVPPTPSGGAAPPQRYARDQRDARRGSRGPQRGIGKSRGGRTAPRSPTER